MDLIIYLITEDNKQDVQIVKEFIEELRETKFEGHEDLLTLAQDIFLNLKLEQDFSSLDYAINQSMDNYQRTNQLALTDFDKELVRQLIKYYYLSDREN